jgi:hypothetical protein
MESEILKIIQGTELNGNCVAGRLVDVRCLKTDHKPSDMLEAAFQVHRDLPVYYKKVFPWGRTSDTA